MGEDLHFTTTDNYYYYLEQLGLLTIYIHGEMRVTGCSFADVAVVVAAVLFVCLFLPI